MKRIVLIFGALIILLLLLFKLSSYFWVTGNLSVEWIIAVLAITFFIVGIWIQRINQPKKPIEQFEFNHKKQKQLAISNREMEVLQAMAKGLSNKEIGQQLFVSESTVKTHVSNLLLKLDAKRRTQAVLIAKQLQLLPK